MGWERRKEGWNEINERKGEYLAKLTRGDRHGMILEQLQMPLGSVRAQKDARGRE